jgi:hypothetical protein
MSQTKMVRATIVALQCHDVFDLCRERRALNVEPIIAVTAKRASRESKNVQ